MEQKRLEIKVGLFVFIGLVLLAALLISFSKGTSLFHPTYTVKMRASNVGGLKPRAAVLLAGVQVGSVSTITLAEDGRSVTIFLKIQGGNKIYHDARFVIEQSGFLGDQFVSIVPVANVEPVLADGAEVNCQEPFNLQEVARSAAGFVQRIDETAKKLDASVTDLRTVVLNVNTLTNFAIAMNNLRDFSLQALDTVHDINGIVATNGEQVGMAVSNVLFVSQQLAQIADSANGLVVTNGPEISAAVKNIESATEILTNLLVDLRSGKGLAGTMMENGNLATNVQVMANNLTIASSNLNRLGLWGFLWHKEPLLTNAPPHSTHTTHQP
jgi:ABC-type transporter Mla subunit MlaD